MIATEEKENKVKYAWKKPTIGNLTAGLSLPLVFCLLSRRNWGFAAKDHNKHYGSQKSFTGRCLRFDRCLCPRSALCPGQKRLICITGERGTHVRSSIVFTARCNYMALSNVWMSTLHVHMGSQYPNILVPLALWLKSDLVYQSHRNMGLDRRCHQLPMYLTKIKNIFAQTLSL